MADPDAAMNPMIETRTAPTPAAHPEAIGPTPTTPTTVVMPPPAATANMVDAFRWLATIAASTMVPDDVEANGRTRTMYVAVPPEGFDRWRTLTGSVACRPTQSDVFGQMLRAESAVPGRWTLILATNIPAGER